MENTDQYIEKAAEFKQNGDYTVAVKMYCKALKQNPDNQSAIKGITELYSAFAEFNDDILRECINTVDTLYKSGHNDEAESLAVSMLNKHGDASLYCLAGEICFSKNNIDNAVKYYSHAVKLNNRESAYYFKSAIAFSIKGFFNEAEECYIKATEMAPDNMMYQYGLAYLYYSNKKYKKAEKVVDIMLSAEPENLKAKAMKILILLAANDLFEAGKIIKTTDTTVQDDDFFRYACAMYYSKLNLPEKTIENLNKASALNHGANEYKYDLAKYYFKQKEYEECDFLCDEMIKNNSKYIAAYVLKAKLLVETGKKEAAETILKQTLKLDTNTAEVYYLMGKINFLNRDYETAADNLRTAISIEPNNSLYYAQTAECYFDEQDFASACLYYKEAAEIDISNAKYRYYAAKCYAMMGDGENANMEYSLMLRLEPDNIGYVEDYAKYLTATGQKGRAVTLLKKTMKLLEDKQDKEKIKEIIKNL